MTDSTVVETAIKNPADTENFAKWIGIDPDLLKDETPEEPEAETADEVQPEPEAEAEAGEAPEAEGDEAEPEEEAKEPIVLPFEAAAGDAPVDPELLANMTVTFKADGKTESLPLTDIVRRAQSEPAAQRQARSAAAEAQRLQQMTQQYEQELENVREIALRMAREPEFWTQIAGEVAAYDTPEARAERAESQLAATRREREEAAQRAEFERAVVSFAQNEVAPTLSAIVEGNPLVTPEEIQGWFLSDTLQWSRGGVVQPEFYPQLAAYLKTELAEKVAQRQSERAAWEAKAKAEARKTQMERQRMKNQTAQATKPPVGAGGPPRDGDIPAARPRNLKDAEKGALSALLGGM